MKLLFGSEHRADEFAPYHLNFTYEDDGNMYQFGVIAKDEEAYADVKKEFEELPFEDFVQKYHTSRFLKEYVEEYFDEETNEYETVMVENGDFYYAEDYRLTHNLSDFIIKTLKENKGINQEALDKFCKKLYKNTDPYVREQLLPWIDYVKGRNGESLTIAPDGDLLGYKACAWNPDLEQFESFHSGMAYVNGECVHGNIPNRAGDILTMPRSSVEANPQSGCSYGLHVGTFGYAYGFGGRNVESMLLIKFSPADVVSVPTDSDHQKVRVCKYRVIGRIKERLPEGILEEGTNLYDFCDTYNPSPKLDPEEEEKEEERRVFFGMDDFYDDDEEDEEEELWEDDEDEDEFFTELDFGDFNEDWLNDEEEPELDLDNEEEEDKDNLDEALELLEQENMIEYSSLLDDYVVSEELEDDYTVDELIDFALNIIQEEKEKREIVDEEEITKLEEPEEDKEKPTKEECAEYKKRWDALIERRATAIEYKMLLNEIAEKHNLTATDANLIVNGKW